MRRRTIPWIVSIGLGFVLSSLGVRPSWGQAADEPAAKVALTVSAIHVLVGTVNNFTAMQVRIQAPNGDLVVNTRSTGEAVSWAPSATSEDGYYRYEAEVFSQDPTAVRTPGAKEEETTGVTRQQVSGPFVVKEGLIVVPADEEPALDKSQSRLEMSPWWQTVLSGIGDFLVPSAHAIDLIAEDTTPEVRFDDTQDETCTSTFDWRINAEGGTLGTDINNVFTIDGVGETPGPCGSTIPIITLRNDGTNGAATSSINSLNVLANGDLGLANNSLFIDRSTGNVGIGTTTPGQALQVIGQVDIGATAGSQSLDIADANPDIGLVDTTDGSEFEIEHDANALRIRGPGAAPALDNETIIASIHRAAPANSLTIAADGKVGIGTATPTGLLHVVDNVDGNSFLWVENPFLGVNAAGVLRAQAGANVLNFQAHSSARTITRFGLPSLGGWAELLAVGSNGLALGATTNIPVIIGTNNTERIRVTNLGVQVFGVFTNSSSRTYKEEIRSLTSGEAAAALTELEPVKFRFKDQSEENLGVSTLNSKATRKIAKIS